MRSNKLTYTLTNTCTFIVLLFCCITTKLSAQFTGGNGDGFASGTIGSSGTEVLLPVTLLSFHLEDKAESVKLVWETASENNNDYFTIERSNNGTDWTAIATIKGSGNSIDMHSYETYDNQPYSGLSYYQLKQTDYDGKSTFSTIESIYRGTGGSFSVFPNPAQNTLLLNLQEQVEATSVTIYNVYGQLVWSSAQYISLKKEASIDVSFLPSGAYFIRVSTADKSNLLGCQFIKAD